MFMPHMKLIVVANLKFAKINIAMCVLERVYLDSFALVCLVFFFLVYEGMQFGQNVCAKLCCCILHRKNNVLGRALRVCSPL